MAAIFKDIGWTAVIVLALLFGVICFLAVLWSKREWNTRKIRVGMFLEREYRTDRPEEEEPPGPDDEDTKEFPTLKG